jgi:hypothetical protein
MLQNSLKLDSPELKNTQNKFCVVRVLQIVPVAFQKECRTVMAHIDYSTKTKISPGWQSSALQIACKD